MEEMNHLVQDIAQNIRALRLAQRLTQKEVAKAIGVHLSQYARIESGVNKISADLLAKTAQFFSVTTDKLFYGEDNLSDNPIIAYPKLSLAQKLKQLETLEKKDKQTAYELIDLLIIKDKLKGLEGNKEE